VMKKSVLQRTYRIAIGGIPRIAPRPIPRGSAS
jgi:hypothetical protein